MSLFVLVDVEDCGKDKIQLKNCQGPGITSPKVRLQIRIIEAIIMSGSKHKVISYVK